MEIIRRLGLALFLLMIMVLLVAGCSQNPSEQVEEIVLGAAPGIYSSPVWIAENKGYFREQRLNVKIREFASGRTGLQSMLSEGGIDIVTAARRRRLSSTALPGTIMPLSAESHTRRMITNCLPDAAGELMPPQT